MSLIIITTLAIVINLVLGLFIILKNPKSATHRLFFIFTLTNAIWALLNYLSLRPPEDSSAIFWLRAHLAASTFHSSIFLLLIINFPRPSLAIRSQRLVPYLLVVFITMLATLSPYVFGEVGTATGQEAVVTKPGVLLPLFALTAFGSIITGLIALIQKYRKSKGKQHEQLRYLLLGTSAMFALVFFCIFIPVVLLNISLFTAYLPAFTFPFVIATAYAIAKHRLFDIRPIIARSVTYTLLLIILTGGYIGGVFGLSRLFFANQANGTQTALYAVLAIVVSITYQPLKGVLGKATNKLFYKDGYSSSEVISGITSIMAETLQLENLTASSLDLIMHKMHVTYGSFWVATDSSFKCAASREHHLRSSHLVLNHLQDVKSSDHILVHHSDHDGNHQKVLRELNASVAVPLFAGDILQGVLLLGDKKSGDVYTEQDINVLKILAPGLATALENARSYKQISEFNVTLEQEVEKATKELQIANSKLFKNNEKLRQLDELKDEFISVTSHELRTPLTSIKGYLWMAMHGKKRDDKFLDYMNKAYVSTERLITMVNDTLDVSRIESGRVELSIEPTNLNKLAQDVVDDLIDRANQFDQQLILKKTRALPLVDCDPTKIYQVLTNLVGNALKFTPSGGKIKVDFSYRGNFVTVRVQDDGPGISLSNQEKLFQKFSRLETTIPGTGLGLYLCMQIIRLSKGKIWIESQEGRGAAFLFTLPVSKTQDTKLEKHPQQFRNIA